MKYRVGTLREAGLEAKWTKTRNGAPIIKVRWPKAKPKHQRERWYYVDVSMWDMMKQLGVIEGFDGATLLADIFFI